jgi:hypothetical protein
MCKSPERDLFAGFERDACHNENKTCRDDGVNLFFVFKKVSY